MAKLNFKVTGKGKPLIILHGLYGSSDNWISIARELMADFKVYTVDLRNHGLSPHLPEHNYQVMVDDIYEFMQEQCIYEALFIGHSMGGKVAMSFAGLYPEKVTKLVVVDISPRSYSDAQVDRQFIEHQKILEGLTAVDVKTITSREEAEQQLAVFVPAERVRQFLMKNLHRYKDKSFQWKINVNVLKANLKEVLKGLEPEAANFQFFKKPVLFIRGSASHYIQPPDEALIIKLFPQAQIITIEGASHWVHAEAPERFLTELKNFIHCNL